MMGLAFPNRKRSKKIRSKHTNQWLSENHEEALGNDGKQYTAKSAGNDGRSLQHRQPNHRNQSNHYVTDSIYFRHQTENMITALLIDDDQHLRQGMKSLLERHHRNSNHWRS